MRIFQCWIPMQIPSKKNGKMMTRGRLITKPRTQAILGQVMLLLKSARNAQCVFKLTECDVRLMIYLSNKRTDLDNVLTSALDCLKDAEVIANDSAKHVHKIYAELFDCPAGQERVGITVRGR